MKLNSIKLVHLNALGEKYPMTMDLNVYSSLQEEYGSLDAWYKEAFGGDESDSSIKALIFTVKEMINEGIDIENETKPVYREHISSTVAGMICTEIGLKGISKTIQEFREDSGGEGKSEEDGDSPRDD